jgi:hypothetical protein
VRDAAHALASAHRAGEPLHPLLLLLGAAVDAAVVEALADGRLTPASWRFGGALVYSDSTPPTLARASQLGYAWVPRLWYAPTVWDGDSGRSEGRAYLDPRALEATRESDAWDWWELVGRIDGPVYDGDETSTLLVLPTGSLWRVWWLAGAAWADDVV